MHSLLALGPAHPGRLAIRLDTHHLLRRRQLCVDARRKRMYQFGPRFVPHPQHGAAVAAEGALRVALLLRRRAAVFNRIVFLDGFLSLFYLQRLEDGAQVDAAAVATAFTADTTRAQLVGHRCVRLHAVFNRAALAACFERHRHVGRI